MKDDLNVYLYERSLASSPDTIVLTQVCSELVASAVRVQRYNCIHP